MTGVLAGDRMPFCYGMTADRQFCSFEAQAGRSAAIILAHAVCPDDLRPVIEDFARQPDAFASRDADVLILGDEDVVRALARHPSASWRIQAIDCRTGFLQRCGAPAGAAVALVVDRNLRVAMRLSPGQAVDVAAACLACLDALPREAARDVLLPAPVLVLPNLLPRELCRGLIERFESGPSIDGGIASIDTAGRPHSRIDHAKKWRRDLPIPPDDAWHPMLRDALLHRCAPEIAKAFQAKVAHTDRILVARYDAPGGWFGRHRDNMAENVAFREFAISVNLNTEEYEGGHLCFPEYNDHRYRPPTGAGVIFSTSLLHEAAPVLRGRRHVLLTFFHGDAAEARRQAYQARTTTAVTSTVASPADATAKSLPAL
jgi:predicted 2-oxoglutarate/Fe(II)-dependent dioxygenase YbiX